MFPRKQLDIDWSDLWFGTRCLLISRPANELKDRIAQLWVDPDSVVSCLSVRTGFDLILQALALPLGSEVIVTPITIPHIVELLRLHGLIPIPVDIDVGTLAPNPEEVRARISTNTRMFLFTYLFGSSFKLDEYVEMAKNRNIVIVEDAAQAFSGLDYQGHPQAHVSMFSFGLIKTATSLGGALLMIREAQLRKKVQSLESSYSVQKRTDVLKKIIRCGFIKIACWPPLFGFLRRVLEFVEIDFDDAVNKFSRGFAGPGFTNRIRKQLSPAVLELLYRRLKGFNAGVLSQRSSLGRDITNKLSPDLHAGSKAHPHTYWVFPILSQNPSETLRHLQANNIDATRHSTSLMVVTSEQNTPGLVNAHKLMNSILYIPIYPHLPPIELERTVRFLNMLN